MSHHYRRSRSIPSRFSSLLGCKRDVTLFQYFPSRIRRDWAQFLMLSVDFAGTLAFTRWEQIVMHASWFSSRVSLFLPLNNGADAQQVNRELVQPLSCLTERGSRDFFLAFRNVRSRMGQKLCAAQLKCAQQTCSDDRRV